MRTLIIALFFFCLGAGSRANIPPDSTKQKRNTFIVLPLVLRSIETGWSFGVANTYTFNFKASDSTVRTSNLAALGLYSLRKQLVLALNGTVYFPKEHYILNLQVSFSNFPDKFWGLGPKSLDIQEENYSFEQFYFSPHLQRTIRKDLYIGLLCDFQKLFKIEYQPGGLFDKQDVIGRTPYQVSGLGGSITYDTRNHAFVPDKGEMLQVIVTHFGHHLGSDFRFTYAMLDARRFISIYKNQVLAIQGYGYFDLGGQMPLRNLATMGDTNLMRGYYSGRYRDVNQIAIQAEYRIPVWRRFGAVLFGGYGDVSDKVRNFDLTNLKYSYGAGLRIALNKKEKLNIRLDYGVGQGNNSGFYFQIGEAF